MVDINSFKNDLKDLKETNKEIEDFLEKTDKKIAELDLKFAKMLIKSDINALTRAKKMLHGKREN